MELPVSIHDSQIASIATLLAGRSPNSGPSSVLAGGSLGMVLLSAVGSIIAYGMLPAQIQIHWTLGMGPYYGPEFAPTLLILILFPVLIAATAGLAYLGEVLMCRIPEFTLIRRFYVVAMLGTLGVLLASQLLLIAANLYV